MAQRLFSAVDRAFEAGAFARAFEAQVIGGEDTGSVAV
jgi:hypothetical protein